MVALGACGSRNTARTARSWRGTMGLDCSVRVDEANLWHLTGTKGLSHSIPFGWDRS